MRVVSLDQALKTRDDLEIWYGKVVHVQTQ
jgi:hypothetical protein